MQNSWKIWLKSDQEKPALKNTNNHLLWDQDGLDPESSTPL